VILFIQLCDVIFCETAFSSFASLFSRRFLRRPSLDRTSWSFFVDPKGSEHHTSLLQSRCLLGLSLFAILLSPPLLSRSTQERVVSSSGLSTMSDEKPEAQPTPDANLDQDEQAMTCDALCSLGTSSGSAANDSKTEDGAPAKLRSGSVSPIEKACCAKQLQLPMFLSSKYTRICRIERRVLLRGPTNFLPIRTLDRKI